MTLSRKSLVKSEQTDQFKLGQMLKIIEHVGYSIGKCTISLDGYSGSSALSNR